MTFHSDDAGSRIGGAARWGAAGLCVAALHAGAVWWLISHPISAAPPAEQAQGIPIELEPVAVPQNAPEVNAAAASGPAPAPQAAAAPTPTPEAQSEPDPEPATPSVPEPPPAPQPEPLPAPAEVAPVPVPQPDPPPVALPQQKTKTDAFLAPALPPKPRQPPKPDPRVVAREVARRKALAEKQEAAREAKAEARAQARAQARTQAAQAARQSSGSPADNDTPSSASSGASVASWRGDVLAHLNGFKPSGMGVSGTAVVAFSVDRSGRVLSASLASSSGDGSLDSAAVSMVRRASPVPAPPPGLGGRISLSVPVRFR